MLNVFITAFQQVLPTEAGTCSNEDTIKSLLQDITEDYQQQLTSGSTLKVRHDLYTL